MSANPRAWNTPMRLAESTDTVLEYRLRATWRIVLLLGGLAGLVPITALAFAHGGSLDRLPSPLGNLFPVAFLASSAGLFATVGLGTRSVRRRVERRTAGDLTIDAEVPVLARGRSRSGTGPTHGTLTLRTLELAPRDVRQVVIERLPGASSGDATRHRYRVAIDLVDGRSVHPWWSFARGATGEAFMRDAAARMHAVMRVGGEVTERDAVRISTYDAAVLAKGGAAAALLEAQRAAQREPLTPAHVITQRADPLNLTNTIAQRALAVTIDSAVCVIGLIGVFWLARTRPDVIFVLALPLYGALRLAYHTMWEGSSGTTLGKRLARLRVVSVDGGPVGYRQAFKRNLARLVDALAFYFVGLVVAAQPGPKRSQRIGDRWAGTIVVDERRIEATLAAFRARG